MNLNKVVFRFVSISFSILVILLVLIGFVKIGTYCYDFGYRVFTEAPVDAEPGRDVVVQISDDMSDMDIAKELKEKGLVEDAKLFFVQLKVSAYSGKLHSGVYTLNTSMTARQQNRSRVLPMTRRRSQALPKRQLKRQPIHRQMQIQSQERNRSDR